MLYLINSQIKTQTEDKFHNLIVVVKGFVYLINIWEHTSVINCINVIYVFWSSRIYFKATCMNNWWQSALLFSRVSAGHMIIIYLISLSDSLKCLVYLAWNIQQWKHNQLNCHDCWLIYSTFNHGNCKQPP